MSQFNYVELAFRYIKKIIYSKIYENLDEVEEDVVKILSNNSIDSTLGKNYRETLETYINYSLNNKYKNLNNLDFSK